MPIDPREFAARRQSFGAAAEVYDRTRPDYAAEAVAWCLEPAGLAPLRVADVGAGTGKLTAVVLALGHEVVAVEPDEDMLARLRGRLGGDDRLSTASGTAEDLPLPDEAVDAVVCRQAWHWFDEAVVGPEFARVLRPGGVAAACRSAHPWTPAISSRSVICRTWPPEPGMTSTKVLFTATSSRLAR